MTDVRRRLLRGMSDIVGDLYGTPPAPAKTAPAAPEKPALPPFDTLWKTADESIDWTDALASPTPTDGLTGKERWAALHALAPRILKGDTAAYLDALSAFDPLSDLTSYVSALDVETVSADVLKAEFTVRADYLQQDRQAYLCGMAVRIARDLFAAVPVLTVAVTAKQGDDTLLAVTFPRQEMNRVRFAFVDPVDFVEKCGGTL